VGGVCGLWGILLGNEASLKHLLLSQISEEYYLLLVFREIIKNI